MVHVTQQGHSGRSRRRSGSETRSVARFTAAGLVVTTALVVLIAVQARWAGEEQARRGFTNLARVAASSLTPSLDTSPTADAATRAVLQQQVAALRQAGPVVRVVVRDAQGRILWSDDPSLVGRGSALTTAQQNALRTGTVGSGTATWADYGGTSAGGSGSLLEAYVGVRDRHGTPLLIHVLERQDEATAAARRIWWRFAPPAAGALVVLLLVQAVLAWRLAGRLGRSLDRQHRLLRAAVEASDAERRRIAGEVHDHVVQDLAGLTLDLDAERLRGGDGEGAALAGRVAPRLRRSIDDLRTLIMTWMPSRLPGERLGPGLRGLAAGLERSGIRVELRDDGSDDLPAPVAALLYRCAQEALRNVVSHSRASTVELSLRIEGGEVTMVVDDDGCGFEDRRVQEQAAAGHVGLRTLGELVADAGGSLTAHSSPGQGTRLVVVVPLRDGAVPVRADALPAGAQR